VSRAMASILGNSYERAGEPCASASAERG
jgi:hypothetical protein